MKDAGMRYYINSPAKEIQAHILLPEGVPVTSVRLNGRVIKFKISEIGSSRYVDFSARHLKGKADIEIIFYGIYGRSEGNAIQPYTSIRESRDSIGKVIDEVIIEDEGVWETMEMSEQDFYIPYQLVETKPLFNSKKYSEDFHKWVLANVKYPESMKEKGVKGRVILTFIVDENGEVRDVKVERGVCPELDKEAIRVVSKSPNWTPGRQRDKPVPVMIAYYILFE